MERSGKVGGILRLVPGYTGYRDKETRRDADRAVREAIAVALQQRAKRIDAVAARVAGAGDLKAVGPITTIARDLRTLETRILTAAYGYGGLFGNRDVDAAALDQIGAFDEALLAGVPSLDEPIAALEAGDLAAVDQARATLTHLERQFSARGQVVETARPSTIVPAATPVAFPLTLP